ncbi:toluene tolerance protein [Pseudomonas songnenensis]|uniref:Toluene tolerance protein n=1 Tax=Pseudomonas songnenensis TaxID=1176259 RepID=A0A482UMQ9_9PSED|nr:toluene tolerance protein [Pseudomonas songnenensis]RYJ64078.1 toluene tolerance protein [Pseudomonas songnenensis]
MPIKIKLNNEMLATLTADAQVLEEDSLGPKVYRLADGNFLKLFRRKRLISSALFVPYSDRFWFNAMRLKELGIPTLTPLELYRLEDTSLSAVLYRPLLGRTLKDIYLDEPEAFGKHLPVLIDFIRTLHRRGIYFRSLHLGNIVLTPEGSLGLIDIADLSFQRPPLSKAKAKRNLAHFARLLENLGLTEQFPLATLTSAVLKD